MAVGKGSMARASKVAAAKNTGTKEETVVKVMEMTAEAESVKADSGFGTKKATVKKGTGKKTVGKKEEAKTQVEAVAVVEVTSQQVMKQIVYQKSSQVLDREAETNESFGVGEAMPIYFF